MNDFEITREKIIIRTRPLKNGNQSIYLEMHHEGKRSTECLHLYLVPEETEEDKKQNELTMLAAQNIRAQRYKEATRKGFSHELLEREDADTKLVDYIKLYCERRKKMGKPKDRRYDTLIYWINKIAPSIQLQDVNRIFALKLRSLLVNTPSDVTGELLRRSSIQELYGIFGHIMQQATDEGKANFRQALLPSLRGLGRPKQTRNPLTFDELQKLIVTPCRNEKTRTAFLFSCATGFRWADLKRLKWKNVVQHDEKWQVEILQSKTRKYVYVPLNKLALSVLPERHEDASKEDLVFDLFAGTGSINAYLREWMEAAGIDKHISYYSGRHTFATLQYELGACLSVTQSNLGHCDMESTMGYTHILEGKKLKVTDKINEIFAERLKKRIVWEKAKEIVKLRFKKLKNGEKSAYFDIYRNGVREYLWQDEHLLPELDEVTKENNQKLMLLFEERRRSLIAEMTIDKSGIANRAFNTDITLLQWLDIYEIELLQRASRSYMRGYSKLKDYLTGFNADILLKDVNEDFVVSFFEHLKRQPCTNHNEKTLSFESCWDMLKKLGNSMNGAIRERHIDANPCHSLLAVCLKKKKKRPLVCLTQEDLLRLIDTPYRQEYVKRQFLFACFTGSTPKTIERLCWKHIYRKDGRTWAILWQSRSRRDIEVPLSDMAVACLPPRRKAKGSCHVFECRRHAIMAIHHENWRKEAGIETPVNYIVAKNTYASLLLGAGADYYTAAYMMGFCTTDYMEEYEGYLNRKKYDSVEKMDSIFSGIANLLAKEPINKENVNLE